MIELIPNIEETFYEEIEEIVRNSNNTYMDVIISWCETKGIEFEYVATIINKNVNLRAKIQGEAENLHYIKRSPRLPI